MTMDWYPTLVLLFGLFDASIIMLGGLILAFMLVMGWELKDWWYRIVGASFALIGSNIAAAIILGATHWLLK